MLEFVLGYSAGSKTAGRAASLARSAAVGDATIHTNRIEDINERIDMMAMLVRGMWALLEEQGFTAEQLMAKLEELDQADGTPDGRIKSAPVPCSSCDSLVPAGMAKCQYCGETVREVDDHPMGQL
ncbi:MAG TPA: hypothetical protein VEB69_06425 [Acidimicrobiia bacterium]|nr:hypothetical protein [Acidimicrobiia bacterium]